MRFGTVLAIACVLAATGCGGRGRSSGAVRAVEPIPSAVDILVEHEGRAPIRIDATLLARAAPDLVAPPWRGWILSKLVPDWDPAAAIDVDDDEGFRSPLVRPGERIEGADPVLLLGPQGETRVVRLAVGHPITAHQGSARLESGRVRHVQRIRLRSQETARSDSDAVAPPPIALKVLVGNATQTWTRSELGRVKAITLMSKDGDGERDAWSLRDLAATLIGPDAIVGEVVGEANRVVHIEEAKWNDRALLPVLRANRRGRLKLVWLTKDLHEVEDDQLRAVTEIRFRRRS